MIDLSEHVEPEVICEGRCERCAEKHGSHRPPKLVTVNLGPGEQVNVYWHSRSGTRDAAGARLTAVPDLGRVATIRHRCHGCGRQFTIKRTRLIAIARDAAATAVNGRCEFLVG